MLRPIFRNLLNAISTGSIAATLLAANVAHAQTLFQPLAGPNSHSVTLPAGTTPQGVAVADFNHDGFPDMVVANYADTSLGTSGTISVYLSSGPGTFLAPATYPTCGGPTAVLAADLDLTGLADIVVTCNSPSSNVIEVFLNLGTGTFNPKVDGKTNIVLGTGLGPVALTLGDFNSDGHPDLAVADSGDGTVTLFLSNPANNFTYYNVQTISNLGAPTGITSGKFTNSGHLDLAVTDSLTQTVRFLKGDGTGAFTPGATAPTQTDPNGIVAGDFNHDGNLDLAVVNAGSGSVSVLFGHGNGTFGPTRHIAVGSGAIGAKSILALDVLGNGNLDLLVGNTVQNNVAFLMNNGNGTFQPVENYAVPNGPAYLAAGDFNRNGKPDLAVTQVNGNSVSVLINNTLPTPEPGGLNYHAPHILTNGHGNMADGVVAADFNHDGLPDIAATYLEDNAVRVLAGTGGGNFRPAVVYPVGNRPYWIATGDLNNDGYADLVTTNTGDDTISVLLNNGDGTGTFATSKAYPVGNAPFQVAIGDLNGDGIPDLAVTNYGDNTVSILYGQTGGTFVAAKKPLQTCSNPYGVAIGDFRHSGQNDVAVTCFNSSEMEVFLNNLVLFQAPPAQTTFQTPVMYPTSVNPTSLVIGDFNRDGNLDIVTGNSIANNVSFFGGNGDGTFKSSVDSFALNFPDSIAAGDVNGDGILDLVTVAANFNEVSILLGKGDGTFQQRMDFNSGQQPWAVALADFNRDGKLDVVTANTVKRVNLTSPTKQLQYIKQFPPTEDGGPSLNVSLNASGTNISLNVSPSTTVSYNQPVTLTATVAAPLGTTPPTGTVIFEDTNGTVIGGPASLVGAGPNSSTASVTVPNLGSGTQQITVLYSGDALYQPNTATGPGFVIVVTGTRVVLTAPSTVTSGTTFSATVVAGTVGNATSPTGTASVYIILPNGTTRLVFGPVPLVPNGNGTSSFTGTATAGTPGTYYGYAVFTPVPANPTGGGTSPTIQITVVK